MSVLYPIFRSALFLVEPERAHRLALEALRLSGRLPARQVTDAGVELMGLKFPNRVGLAAGFDKNADAVDGLGRVGFGFLEIGTVTPRPQSGQMMPRLFRLRRYRSLVNRMGFPSDGAAAVAARLRLRRYSGIVGVSIGKNADTPLGRAVDDYSVCLRTLHAVADYIAVNISSPNTTALRDLHEPEQLESLLRDLLAERNTLAGSGGRRLPLLLKVSPDLDSVSLEAVARVARAVSLDGIIATNTTVRRDGISPDRPPLAGGLSGPPLRPLSLATVTILRRLLGPQFPLIGVGGIDSPEAAVAMRSAGADLVQLFTGLVYEGPSLPVRCARALAARGEEIN